MDATVVTEEQRQLAIEKADALSADRQALSTLLRDGTVNLLAGDADPGEAIPVLDRLVILLKAAGRDTGAILEDALSLAAVRGMRGVEER